MLCSVMYRDENLWEVDWNVLRTTQNCILHGVCCFAIEDRQRQPILDYRV